MKSPAPSEQEILEGVYEIFRTALGYQGELSPQLDLIEAELDSVLILQLVVEVEDRFRVVIDEGDEQNILTIADLVRLVEAQHAS